MHVSAIGVITNVLQKYYINKILITKYYIALLTGNIILYIYKFLAVIFLKLMLHCIQN